MGLEWDLESRYQMVSTFSVMEAKLFMNGRSQAVRLPKEFRFEGESLSIQRPENTMAKLKPSSERKGE